MAYFEIECGCRVHIFNRAPEDFTEDCQIKYCPKHAVADTMYKTLVDTAHEFERHLAAIEPIDMSKILKRLIATMALANKETNGTSNRTKHP